MHKNGSVKNLFMHHFSETTHCRFKVKIIQSFHCTVQSETEMIVPLNPEIIHSCFLRWAFDEKLQTGQRVQLQGRDGRKMDGGRGRGEVKESSTVLFYASLKNNYSQTHELIHTHINKTDLEFPQPSPDFPTRGRLELHYWPQFRPQSVASLKSFYSISLKLWIFSQFLKLLTVVRLKVKFHTLVSYCMNIFVRI